MAVAALRNDMKEGDNRLEGSITALKGEVKELRGEMNAGFMNLGERVSKLEGVIKGRFPGAQNQPQEGVAYPTRDA